MESTQIHRPRLLLRCHKKKNNPTQSIMLIEKMSAEVENQLQR